MWIRSSLAQILYPPGSASPAQWSCDRMVWAHFCQRCVVYLQLKVAILLRRKGREGKTRRSDLESTRRAGGCEEAVPCSPGL